MQRMENERLTLDEYQSRAVASDRTRNSGGQFDLPVLGLFGEAGSLLSEVKKKQRDSSSYIGFEASVLEEMGDVLWYLSIIAHHAGIQLSTLGKNLGSSSVVPPASRADNTFSELQPQHTLALQAPTVAFERTLLRLAGEIGQLALRTADGSIATDRENLVKLLCAIFGSLLSAANEAGVILESAAVGNLYKTSDRWPVKREFPRTFDDEFPFEEQLPRKLTVDIFERVAKNGRHYVVQRCNEIHIGDHLTDNITKPDDYRFHDVFHYANAAILGWSPVIRALLRLKRKSETKVDEGQDGARAILIEEGVATYIFGQAKQLEFFKGQKPGELSFTLLKSVRQFVSGYEVEACPLWLWEETILQGNSAFRFLQEHRRGRLQLNLAERSLRIEELPG
jgi:NTP pyrophosphatase (non-canonical NTP hydrolase)